jgi:antitoxin HicB
LPEHYTVSDGELVLFLWPAEEGGYNVTSPLDPALITQAETVEDAFVMARDASQLLNEARSSNIQRFLDEGAPLTEAQQQDLTHRVASYNQNAVSGSSWEELKTRLTGTGHLKKQSRA